MTRKLLPLAFVVALASAACAEPLDPAVEFGSGQRFVPFVADPLNDAGVHPSVIVGEDGLPVVTYFGFEEETAEGQLPQARPVGAPSLPGVLMATVSQDGVWTRGAMAQARQVPTITIPFGPGVDESVANLTPASVTGLQIVADAGTLHAVWGSADGTYYATGSVDPSSTTPFTIERVSETPPVGPSIAIVDGEPWIAYSTSTSASASVEAATVGAGGWDVETVAAAAGCDACRTAMLAGADGPAVAWSDGGDGVSIATPTAGGWSAEQVSPTGGLGLSGAVTGDGVALAYYDGEQVVVATGSPAGAFQTASAVDVAADSPTADGAGTSIAADDNGTLWLAWLDAAEGVRFASGGGEGGGPTPIETAPDTANGAMPSVAVTPEGTTAYLAWYDTVNQDLLVGAYGDVEGLAIAAPSPEAGPPQGGPTQPPDQECTQAEDGVVTITAQGIQFDTGCIEVPAGEPFQIEFLNEDEQPHNVAIYPSADELSADAALMQGEVFTGVDTRTYDVPALDAGGYYFQCDVHPTMNGTLNVVEPGGGGGATGATGATGETGGGGGGGATSLTVVAQNIAFDTDTIELPADTATTITFQNQDPPDVLHNIAIYSDDSLSEVLFPGDVIPGGETIEYEIPALPAGEYYFRCDVHPNMNGTVVVG